VTTTPKKILIVRLSSIGDIILTTALLRCLRKTFPSAEITFLVKEQFRQLLEYSPFIDHLVTLESRKGFSGLRSVKRQFRKEKFDLFIDLHKNLRSLYLRTGIIPGRITTYSKQILRRTLLIWFKINLYGNVKPVMLRYFEAVKKTGVLYDGDGTDVHLPPGTVDRVKGILNEKGYLHSQPLIIVCPSATYENKKWPQENFIITASRLISETGAFIIVHGGKADTQLCERIAVAAGNNATSLAGSLDLSETAALLGLAGLVIANDSGLLHLAQSQKTPVVGIYGPTTRELGFFPIEHASRVIETGVSCRPCTHKGLDYCPRKHFRCMRDIDTERVISAAKSLLNSSLS
jgi:heptosyltransferase-2